MRRAPKPRVRNDDPPHVLEPQGRPPLPFALERWNIFCGWSEISTTAETFEEAFG
jgi:hypothetical protein